MKTKLLMNLMLDCHWKLSLPQQVFEWQVQYRHRLVPVCFA
ncbi:hypothetical protein ACXO18_07815 [Lactobacillus delbrueckii subsp. bulgaricus]